MIEIDQYSELKLICWDTSITHIDEHAAFIKYVTRWHYICIEKLSKKEQELIDKLTQEIGKGHFFPRRYGQSQIDDEFKSVTIAESDIEEPIVIRLKESNIDMSYPGMRNGVQYYWRSDYEALSDLE